MIENSSTYVIDLDSLQDPDDVKKDNFGVWKYTGSHVNDFQCHIMESGKVKVGKGVLSSSDKYEQFDYIAPIQQTVNFVGCLHLLQVNTNIIIDTCNYMAPFYR